jgi:hypothetical protein
MSFFPGWVVRSPKARVAVLSLLAIGLSGCPRISSPDQARKYAVSGNVGFKEDAVAGFGGKVTVDGQPTAKGSKLFVILNDFAHLDENAKLSAPRLYATCDPEGKFAFTTDNPHDGVAAGKYIVTFVQFRVPTNTGTGKGAHFLAPGAGLTGTSSKRYRGPDELKNLYSDPEQNAKDDKFVVDLKPKSPGKGEYDFDLSIAGKDSAPDGPNAVKEIRTVH